jgi:thiamine biosynthesis lipoprotein
VEYFEFQAMNSTLTLAAEGESAQVENGFQEVKRLVNEFERRFTRFSDTSELAALNHHAGNWIPVSPEMFEILWQARQYNDRTNGLFNPSILPALKAAGYDRSMQDIRANGMAVTRPSRSGRDALPVGSNDFQKIEFDLALSRVRLPAGMQIDLGGIAKGCIAGRAAQHLARFCTAGAVNAGGDIALFGHPGGEISWEVAIEDPCHPDQDLAVLHLGPGAIATSSVVKRRWKQGEQWQHHLIDPRSGRPAQTDWQSVTVIAPQIVQAEVFAKALLIAGSNGAQLMPPLTPEIAFIAVDQHNTLLGTPNSRKYLDVSITNL